MSILLVVALLVMVYIIITIVIGVRAYVEPISELLQEYEEWEDWVEYMTPKEINTIASVTIAIAWPYLLLRALLCKKARK